MSDAVFQLSVENWHQVQDLLADALERPSAQRAAFLDAACAGTPSLRAEVESLLEAYTQADGFLDELDTAGVAALLAEDAETGCEVGPYRIVRVLGRGGMGVVYLAEDTRLDRSVALKFLPTNLAANEVARRRLLAEAKAAAALDHPNIAVVHEVGETDDGRLFIAMAYYEGETLREKIRHGPLPLAEALHLARQIAEGLRASHRQGIVHRDIKPSNILITEPGLSEKGVAKIVDFGIARLMDAELTKTGATLGTVAYMSPEQTRGEAVDACTDLWSLGVVLYEMLTGRRPFRGESDQTVIYAIRHDTPELVTDVRPEIPASLAHIVERCLEKDVAQRYPDAEALLADLETFETRRFSGWRTWWTVRRFAAVLLAVVLLGALYLGLRAGQEGDTPSGAYRLAVLPLDNLSPNAEDEYFAAGMTEELISRLSKLSGLRVIGRTSVMRYADTDKSITEIGQELDVEAVLEGSVRKDGEEVRITVQLIDVESQASLWGEDYDAALDGVLNVQREIAQEIAAELNVQMRSDEQRRLGDKGTNDPEAYTLYLKGRHFMNRWTEASITQARDHFQQAIDRDPGFAEAWAGLANTYKIFDYLAVLSAEEASPRSRAAAERALELDPELAGAHAALATVFADYYWDWEAAGRHYRRAIELDPSYATGHQLYAEYLRDQGRFEEALVEIEKAQELDPLSSFYQMVEGIILDMARRPDEAIAQYERLLGMNPNYRMVHLYIGLAYVQKGQYEAAFAEMEVVDPRHTFPDAVSLRGLSLAAMGRTAEAHEMLDELDELSRKRYVSPFTKAVVHLGLGDKNRVLDLLEQAAEERSWFVRLLKVWVGLDPLRSDPRFQALLEKVGLAE